MFLGNLYHNRGETEKARSHLARRGAGPVQFDDPLMQQLSALIQGGSRLVVSAGRARSEGDLDTAIVGFRRALEIDPDNNAVRLNLASTLIQKGDLTAAQTVLEEALQRDPENSSPQYNMGMVLLRQEQRQLALTHLRRAIELAPDFVDAHLNYALLLQELGQLQESERQFAAAVSLDPTDAEIRFHHAAVLLQLQRADEALAELKHALVAAPDSVDGLLLMARAQGSSGDFVASAESFARVLELDPGHREAGFARALALLLAERYDDALQHLQKSLRQQPDNTSLRHMLARLLATCPDESIRDGARSLSMARGLMQTQPTLDHAQTLAMALAETGRFAEAQSLQQQIIEQASRVGDTDLEGRLRRDLALFERQQAVRAPWLRGH